jgi:hypothetical protein
MPSSMKCTDTPDFDLAMRDAGRVRIPVRDRTRRVHGQLVHGRSDVRRNMAAELDRRGVTGEARRSALARGSGPSHVWIEPGPGCQLCAAGPYGHD